MRFAALPTLFATFYLLLQAYILNNNLINQTLTGVNSLSYKVTLTFYVLTGYLQSLPPLYAFLTVTTAILIGVNGALVIRIYQKAREMGTMKFSFGGTSMLAVVSSGCPSCGVSLLSFLGPSSTAFSFLLADIRIQFLVLGLLAFSVLYNLRKLKEAPACEINADGGKLLKARSKLHQIKGN